jgi:hypothetical protein
LSEPDSKSAIPVLDEAVFMAKISME